MLSPCRLSRLDLSLSTHKIIAFGGRSA